MTTRKDKIIMYSHYDYSDKYKELTFASSAEFDGFIRCAKLTSPSRGGICFYWASGSNLGEYGLGQGADVTDRVKELLGVPKPSIDLYGLFVIDKTENGFVIGHGPTSESQHRFGPANSYYGIFENLSYTEIPLDDPRFVGLKLHGKPPIAIYENYPKPGEVDWLAIFQIRFKSLQT